MLSTTKKGFSAAMLAMLGIGSLPTTSDQVDPRKYAPAKRRRGKAGSKLARKAAAGTLTGNKCSVYCQGIMRQFARNRANSKTPLV
jgi:hypothetical protein